MTIDTAINCQVRAKSGFFPQLHTIRTFATHDFLNPGLFCDLEIVLYTDRIMFVDRRTESSDALRGDKKSNAGWLAEFAPKTGLPSTGLPALLLINLLILRPASETLDVLDWKT
jgi:hypothetical protein